MMTHNITIDNMNIASKKEVLPFENLCKSFLKLITEFKSSFRELAEQSSHVILIPTASDWVNNYLYGENGTKCSSLDDIFEKIDPYYDFFESELIVDMSEVFLEDAIIVHGDSRQTCFLLEELKRHLSDAKVLWSSTTIATFRRVLKEKYEPIEVDVNEMPVICIQLQMYWDKIVAEGLKLLIEKLLPLKRKQSLIKFLSTSNESVTIKYVVLDCTVDNLTKYAVGKLEFMRLIGIFSLYIDDNSILQEDENMSFTFELALLKAVIDGNSEAVDFILQLQTVNINNTNEEGKTALMLACERGHENIVHSLLSAGANVNLQDNKGATALVKVNEHMCNHIAIMHMLLQANPAPQNLAAVDVKFDLWWLIEWLDLLVDWKSLGPLVEMTQQDKHQKLRLFSNFLHNNPNITWRDVLKVVPRIKIIGGDKVQGKLVIRGIAH